MHDTSFEFFGPTKIKSDTTDEVKSVLVSTEPSGRSSYVYDIKTGQVIIIKQSNKGHFKNILKFKI